MSNRLIRLLKDKPELLDLMNECVSKEELFDHIKGQIDGYTMEEFQQDGKELASMCSDDELENVSGGAVVIKDISNKEFFTGALAKIIGLFT